MRSTKRRVVLDAGVVLRRLLEHSPKADTVLRNDELLAPAVLVPETLNGLVKEVHYRGLPVATAAALLQSFLALPIEFVRDSDLAGLTLGAAAELGLTAYDASYVALASDRELALVTADKRVAERYPRSELIP